MVSWKSFASYCGLYFIGLQPSLNSCHAADLPQGRDFIFIRHGQTDWGRADILQGPLDLELNALGCGQAERAYNLISKLGRINTPVIYSSSLRRAHQTAEIITKKLPSCPSVNLHAGLKERYYGDYSKVSPEFISTYTPSDAESVEEFHDRLRTTLTEIFKQAPRDNSDLIIVSHHGVFKYFVEWLTQEKARLSQGGVCHFKFAQGKYSVKIYETETKSQHD